MKKQIQAKQLPEGWTEKELREVCEKITDGSHNPPSKKNNGFMMLSSKDIQNMIVDFSDPRFINKEEFTQEDKRTRISEGDVLLTIVGALGRVAIIKKGFPAFTLQRSVAVIKPKKELDSSFFAYYLMSPKMQNYIQKNAKGVAQKGIYLNDLKKIKIIYPLSIKHQTEIVQEIEKQLTRLDATVKALNSVKEKLGVYRKAFLKAAFEGNWEKTLLEEFIEINGRIGWKGLKRSEYSNSGALFLAVRNINKDGSLKFDKVDHISDFRYEESPNMKLRENDIIITKDGTIGKIGYVNKLENPTTVNSSLLIVRPKEKFIPRFLFHYFRSPFFQSIVYEKITGTAVPHLFQRDIKKLIVPKIPEKEQKEIIQSIELKFSVIDKIEQVVEVSLEKADMLRKSILKSAFEGRLVKEFEDD